jgi:hypothetical protein
MTTYKITEEMRKLLTEVLGEKYHEWVEQIPFTKEMKESGFVQVALCSCGTFSCHEINRTFTTDQDRTDLFRKLVELGKFNKFLMYLADASVGYFKNFIDKDDTYYYGFRFIEDLLIKFSPERACVLVSQYWKENKR